MTDSMASDGSSMQMSEVESDDGGAAEARVYYGGVGLANLGNTCYINSSVQALAACPPFSAIFLECMGYINVPRTTQPVFTTTLHELIGTLRKGVERPTWYTPHELARQVRQTSPIFQGYDQHDAEEFIKFLIDRLDKELLLTTVEQDANGMEEGGSAVENGVDGDAIVGDGGAAADAMPVDGEVAVAALTSQRRVPYSVIRDLFEGRTATVVQCSNCDGKTVREEACEGLQLAVSKPIHLKEEMEAPPPPSPWLEDNFVGNIVSGGLWVARQVAIPIETVFGPIFPSFGYGDEGEQLMLEECLENYFAEEEMVEDNQYECDSCGGMQDAHRQLFLTRAPELLMITLKRFEYTRHGPRKLNRSVQFPLTGLDLTRFIRRKSRKGVPSPCSYHLCAMITHRGRPFGGHYFAYAFSQADNCWYCYDDDDVYSVRASTVAAEQAYILMYQRGESRQESPRNLVATVTAAANAAAAQHAAQMTLISRRWLALAETMHIPPPIDNRDFVCQHGRFLPDRVATLVDLAQEITRDTYTSLADQHGEREDSAILTPEVCGVCAAQLEALNTRRAAEHGLVDESDGGPLVYLVNKEWFTEFESFVLSTALDVSPPGRIDNKWLLTPGGTVRQGMRRGSDFYLLTRAEWRALEGIYGGGPCLVLTPGDGIVVVESVPEPAPESDTEPETAVEEPPGPIDHLAADADYCPIDHPAADANY